jgi:hypothetical protein
MQVYNEVDKLGLLQHSRSLTAFLQACWGADLSEVQVQRVFSAVHKFRQARRPAGSVYAALLTFCTRQAVPERAMDVFAAVQEVGAPLCALGPWGTEQEWERCEWK